MGSLMPGWDSPTSGGIEKRKSFTKEEVENFWKIMREVEEEHLKISIVGSGNRTFSTKRPAGLEILKSFSDRDNEDVQFVKDEESLRNKKLTWWTKSNLAFLNESPLSEMEGPAHIYEGIKKK